VLTHEGVPVFRGEQTAWGAVVSFERTGSQAGPGDGEPSTSGRGREAQWNVDVLVNCWPKSLPGQGSRKYAPFLPRKDYHVA